MTSSHRSTPARGGQWKWLTALGYAIFLSSLSILEFGCGGGGEEKSSRKDGADERKEAGGGRFEQADRARLLSAEKFSSNNCRECHAEIFEQWENSHHGLANRPAQAAKDKPAFTVREEIGAGEARASVNLVNQEQPVFRFAESGPAAEAGEMKIAEMAIGVFPLIQYLIPKEGGRWQSTELAWDPEAKEWFNIYGEQNRRTDEWGSWHGRGMNWNSMCAECHMTDYKKNYDDTEDIYFSTWEEQGVGCIQCHGEVKDCPSDVHEFAINRKETEPDWENVMMDNCAACHSRRGNLTGEFQPGDKFADHFRLQLPTQAGLYYPDGQIRDEVYVYGSFKMSAMGHAGVTCLDCHNPHSNELILPYENNALCMRCHGAGGELGAPIINPTEHSFHPAGSTGNQCVECHMTHTTYMGRDDRRDHGYHSPDPVLTKELGIPNACNKCHTEETVEWAIEWSEKWYGEKLAAGGRRERARAVAAAYEGQSEAAGPLLEALRREKNEYWKATYLTLASNVAPNKKEVIETARAFENSENAYLRKAAVTSLAYSRDENDWELVRNAARTDPVRDIRLETAWLALESLNPDDAIYEELKKHLRFVSDQPTGAAQRGEFYFRQRDFKRATTWLKKALSWDAYSAPLYQGLATAYSAMGESEKALSILERGNRTLKNNARIIYSLALLRVELGQMEQAQAELERTVQLEPEFDRAWYNLGLLYAQQENLGQSVTALRKAIEAAEGGNADYYYALATIYIRQQKLDEANEAARDALRVDPQHVPSRQFLQQQGEAVPQ